MFLIFSVGAVPAHHENKTTESTTVITSLKNRTFTVDSAANFEAFKNEVLENDINQRNRFGWRLRMTVLEDLNTLRALAIVQVTSIRVKMS